MSNENFVAVATPQPDSGKTLIAIALATQLAKRHDTFLLDMDNTNAAGTGTATKLLSQRCGDMGFQFGKAQKHDEPDPSICVVDSARSPADFEIKAVKSICRVVFIPVTDNHKTKAEAAKFYQELKNANVRPVIVVNLVNGGDYESISGYFDALDAEISLFPVPKCEAAAKLVAEGLPLSWCRKSDKNGVNDFLFAIGQLADIVELDAVAKPVLAEVS